MTQPYRILQNDISCQQEIKKSRFITYLAHVQGKPQALDYLQSIRVLHKEARHHCWAYIAGSPKDSLKMGCSDDGEPKGTAGKPMLSVLQGTNIGEIMAVIVRYSGGIKLGTGGLVRAYAGGIQQLLPTIQTVEKRLYRQYELHCDYAQMALIENLLSRTDGRIVKVEYLQSVSAVVEVDLQFTEQFNKQLEALTKGRVSAGKIP